MDRLEGIYCALWTPTDEKGEIIWPALESNLEIVLDGGVQGIMALGSTGEFVHLTLQQRKSLLERIIGLCRSRGRQVIANVSDVQVRNVVDLARHARQAGADCIALLPPWFFPLEQRDLAAFFIEAARRAECPLALYNYPEVTGKRISLETVEEVACNVKVIAFKQSGGEFEYHHDLLKLGKKLGFSVLTGADTRLEEALRLGCTGTISGLANSVPRLLSTIFQKHQTGTASADETARVSELSRRIAPLGFPWNVKATIAARGQETGVSKFPISAQTKEIYDRVVADLSGWYQRDSSVR